MIDADARRRFRERVFAMSGLRGVGIYDALSAKLAEEAGFDAVMTGGYSISASYLAKPDIGVLTLTENAAIVRNVSGAVSAPIIADIDTGFGNAINLQRAVVDIEQAGASGAIIEDQVTPKKSPSFMARLEIVPIDEAVGKIEAAVAARRDPNFLIVARTDALDPREAIARGLAYAQAGADLIQPISRTFSSFAELRGLHEAVRKPLSLQLLGWLADELTPDQIDSVAGIAFHALTPIMTVAAALRANYRALVRGERELPIAPAEPSELNALLGKAQIEEAERRFIRGQ